MGKMKQEWLQMQLSTSLVMKRKAFFCSELSQSKHHCSLLWQFPSFPPAISPCLQEQTRSYGNLSAVCYRSFSSFSERSQIHSLGVVRSKNNICFFISIVQKIHIIDLHHNI